MSAEPTEIRVLELALAKLLHVGTWVASTVVAGGLALTLLDSDHASASLIRVGIGLFIFLPCLRVIVMLAAFVKARDYRFVAIAALVLIILITGVALGLPG